MKLHELQQARAAAVSEMRALTDKADVEKRDLTEAEGKTFDDLKKKVGELDTKIARAQAVADFERSAPAITHTAGRDGAFEERARDFSVLKVLRSSLPGNEVGNLDLGFEREISAEVARRTGKTYEGWAVPDAIFEVERRVLLAGSSAADLIPNVHRADLFVDRLRNALVCAALGGSYLDGMIGSPIDIPRQVGSSVATWVGEDGEITPTDASFDDISLSPKTVGAITSFSRRTLLNASPNIEQIVRSDLAAIIASAIDEKAMIGDGTGNTPVGIVNAGTIEIEVPSEVDWPFLLAFAAEIEGSNALLGSLGWALSPWWKARLRGATKLNSDGSAGFLMDSPNELAGYRALSTNALPGTAPNTSSPVGATAIFGNWSDLLIASWSGVDILANPFEAAAYARGRVLIRAMKDVDVKVRRQESFTWAENLPT